MIYEDIQEKYSSSLADKIFNSPAKTLLKPIMEIDENKVIFMNDIEPEVTKEDFINSFKNVNYLWIFFALLVAFQVI